MFTQRDMGVPFLVQAGNWSSPTWAPNHFDFLREEHHDRWMGFDRAEIQRWFEQAGLQRVSVGDVGGHCCADSACGTQCADVSIFLAIGAKRG